MKRAILLFALAWLGAPPAAAEWLGPETKKPERYAARSLDKVLADNPLPAGENIKAVTLFENERTKHVLVQVREREPPHIHADSDITVWLLRGRGAIHIAGKTYPVRTGDVIHVPRDAVHYYVNHGPETGAALVVYSPAPGPEDRVLIRE